MKKQKAIMVLLILVFLSRMLLRVVSYHLISWDESVFMGMGRWIFSGGAVGLWEIIRPVGLPSILGILWKAGLDYETVLLFVSVLFELGVVFLTYKLAERLFNSKIALLSSIVLLITPVFFYYSFFTLTGIPSVFFVLLSLFLVLKKRYVLAGIFSGMAFLFRYPAALVSVAIGLILLYELIMSKNRKDVIKGAVYYIVPFVLIVSLYLVYNQIAYGSFIRPIILAGAHQSVNVRNVPGVLLSILYYPYTLVLTNVFLLSALFQKRKNQGKDQRNMHYVIFSLLVFFSYFAFIPHKQPRFALMFLPFVCILASVGFFNLKSSHKFHAKYKTIIISIILGVILLHPVFIDYKLCQGFPREKPEIVSDYYEFISRNNITGNILTTDPVVNLYSNNRFIQFYNNITDANLIYDMYIDNVSAIVYTPASFPCLDERCNISKRMLEKKIHRDARLVYNKTVWGEQRQIYRKD